MKLSSVNLSKKSVIFKLSHDLSRAFLSYLVSESLLGCDRVFKTETS